MAVLYETIVNTNLDISCESVPEGGSLVEACACNTVGKGEGRAGGAREDSDARATQGQSRRGKRLSVIAGVHESVVKTRRTGAEGLTHLFLRVLVPKMVC